MSTSTRIPSGSARPELLRVRGAITTTIGSAASCNTLIDSFELASDGTRNLDFNLTPSSQWPPGLFRVEIYVNSKPDSVVDFTVR